MQNPVADIITYLLQQGRAQGLPMQPSGGLQRQLANMKTSTPDIASVMAPNVEVIPGPDMRQFGTPMDKDIWLEMLGENLSRDIPLDLTNRPEQLRSDVPDIVPEPSTPISQDPWFKESDFQEYTPQPNDPPIRPLDMIDPSATGRAHSNSMTSGPLHIWATGKNGQAVRLDGPFQSQSEALQALADIEKEIQSTNPSMFSRMSLSIGPDRE